MYTVKPYIEENPVEKVVKYGVYQDYNYNGYKIDIDCNDNLVVLCYDENTAKEIAELLNKDMKYEEDMRGV